MSKRLLSPSAPLCFGFRKHTRVPEILLMSEKVISRLDKADVEIIKQAAKETQEFEIQKWQQRESAAEKDVRINGCTITELSQAEFKKFQDAMQPLYKKYGSQYSSIINEIQNTY